MYNYNSVAAYIYIDVSMCRRVVCFNMYVLTTVYTNALVYIYLYVHILMQVSRLSKIKDAMTPAEIEAVIESTKRLKEACSIHIYSTLYYLCLLYM